MHPSPTYSATITKTRKWTRAYGSAYQSEGWVEEPVYLVTFADGRKVEVDPRFTERWEMVRIAGEDAVVAYEAVSGEGWYEPIDPVIEQNRLMGGLLSRIGRAA